MNTENSHRHIMEDAASYDRFIEEKLVRTYPQTARRIIDEYGITEGRCLDIGCGTGRLEIEKLLNALTSHDNVLYLFSVNHKCLFILEYLSANLINFGTAILGAIPYSARQPR